MGTESLITRSTKSKEERWESFFRHMHQITDTAVEAGYTMPFIYADLSPVIWEEFSPYLRSMMGDAVDFRQGEYNALAVFTPDYFYERWTA